MKRLAMAATFALALSLGGWGQAAAQADERTTAQAGDVQAPGGAGNSDAESPGTEDPPTDPGDDAADPGTPNEPGDGEESTDPGGDENGADPGGGEEAADPGEGSDEPTEDSTPIDASFSLDQSSMPVDEAAEAIPYTITGLKAGDTVTAGPGENGSITVDSDGTFNGELRGNTELKAGDVVDVTVTVARDGEESKTFTGSVEITDSQDDSDAAVSVDPQSQKLADFLENGVNINLVNCHVDSKVKFQVSTAKDPDIVIWDETQEAGEDAAGSARFLPDGDGGKGWIGDFNVVATCGDKSAETTFTVADDGSVVDPKLSINPQTISGEDFIDRDQGVQLMVNECVPDADVRFEVYSGDKSEKLYEQTATTNEEGATGIHVYGLGDDPAYYVGTYQVFAECMDVSRSGKFVVTGGEPGGGNGEDSGEAGGGSSMPRTGAELTGLTAGALLILGGGAAIGLARRKNKS